MFYLKYLFAEIFRRFGKTITIVTGLAVASGIIITIISFSKSLSDSQKTVLNPLENVGTDIMVTRSVGSDGVASLDQATRQEYQKENRVTMDFAKLGNPGDSFSNDQFMSGTMLTYDSSVTDKVDKNQVANFAQGLILNITHQEGTIPKVTAQFETGGETIDVDQKVTDEQRQAMEDAFRKAEEAVRAKGIDPRSEEGRAAMKEALGDSMPSFKTQIKTQRRTYTQDVGPISTDVKTENYTISGVDTSKTDIGLILPSQITIGSWFSGEDNQIIINKSYADKYGKKVGDEIILSNTKYKVIGIVEPKLYTNTTDFYLPISVLQKITGNENRINILLVKTTNANLVEQASSKLGELFTGATIVNSKDTAQKVTGSLVQAANLTNKFIGITSIIVVIASFIIVSLLVISAINKRVREIGTLKAIGWSNLEVIRQILSESIVLGILGAALGVVLGICAILILNHYNISFNATISSLNSTASNFFGRMDRARSSSTPSLETSVQLKVGINYVILALGAAVALSGAILSGFFAALKVSRLKPQVALRNLE